MRGTCHCAWWLFTSAGASSLPHFCGHRLPFLLPLPKSRAMPLTLSPTFPAMSGPLPCPPHCLPPLSSQCAPTSVPLPPHSPSDRSPSPTTHSSYLHAKPCPPPLSLPLALRQLHPPSCRPPPSLHCPRPPPSLLLSHLLHERHCHCCCLQPVRDRGGRRRKRGRSREWDLSHRRWI